MSKIDLDTIATGYNLTKINSNFQKIEDELNNKVFYRDNPAGEDNIMHNTLDMNSQHIINLPAPISPSEPARLQDVQSTIAGLPTASLIPFTPYLDISSTNTQGAIQEVKDDVTSLSSTVSTYISNIASSIGSSLIGFIQAGVGAISTTIQSKIRGMDVDISDFGGVGNGITSVNTAANAAITYLVSVGGGTLRFGRGTYVLNNNEKINIPSGNIRIIGQGKGSTILKRVGAGATALIESFSTSTKFDIEIRDLTIDCNSINSGIQVQYVSRFSVINCHIKNNQVWGISIGISNGLLTTLVNNDVLIEGCFFSGGKVTFENLLLFNSERVTVNNCFFSDGHTGGTLPALGLYQNLESIVVSNCHFTDIDFALYYSLSTNNIAITGCSFTDCIRGILGANTPDNGTFGFTNTINLNISDCIFIRNSFALQLGAVFLSSMSGCTFSENINSLVINYGNSPTNSQPSSCTVSNCQFHNNNSDSGLDTLHAPVLFSGGGGALAITFYGCHFLDNQGVKTQLTPVDFEGIGVWSGVNFFGCSLVSYGAGASIKVSGGSTLSNVKLYGCLNLSALPAGTTVV